MMLQMQFPHIDPVFLRLGPVQLRWYGLMYMVSFIIGYFLLKSLAKQRRLKLTSDDLYDLLFYIIIGVMVGGRIGYVLFYDLRGYLQAPLDILKIWQGGMSFHGGLIGIVLATLYITNKKGWDFWDWQNIGGHCSVASGCMWIVHSERGKPKRSARFPASTCRSLPLCPQM